MADISLVLTELENYVRGGGEVDYTLTRDEAISLFHHTNLIDEKEIKRLREKIDDIEAREETLNDEYASLEDDKEDILEEIKNFHEAMDKFFHLFLAEGFPQDGKLYKGFSTLLRAEKFLCDSYNRYSGDDEELPYAGLKKEDEE